MPRRCAAPASTIDDAEAVQKTLTYSKLAGFLGSYRLPLGVAGMLYYAYYIRLKRPYDQNTAMLITVLLLLLQLSLVIFRHL